MPPLTGDAVKVTDVPGQKGLGVAVIATSAGSEVFSCIVITFPAAGLFVVQSSDEVRMQVTKSPFDGEYVKLGLFKPTLLPFTCHWYWGETPPFVDVVAKVTELPGQNGFSEGVTVILTGKYGLTVTVNCGLFAGLFVVQISEEVIMQFTISPFDGVYMKLGLFVPVLMPLTCH